jgi:hypothetical protein
MRAKLVAVAVALSMVALPAAGQDVRLQADRPVRFELTPPPPPPQLLPEEPRLLVQQWYFWLSLGAATTLVAMAVFALGVLPRILTYQLDTPIPPPCGACDAPPPTR